MDTKYSPDDKVYPTGNNVKLSMTDMLAYFEKQGALRVSDLHIKIGTTPAYRIDGDLVRLKGESVTPELARALLYSLLTEGEIKQVQAGQDVDCSYPFGTLQFRINIFVHLAFAVSFSDSLRIPDPEFCLFPGLIVLSSITAPYIQCNTGSYFKTLIRQER